MESILTSIFIFSASLIAHLLIRRAFRPKREILTLSVLFIAVPFSIFVGMTAAGLWTLQMTAAVASMNLAISLAYMQTYPALVTLIPTFRITLLLHQAGPAGLSESDLIDALSDRTLMFENKINELECDGFAARTDRGLKLNALGRLTADFFIWYRRVLGLRAGRG